MNIDRICSELIKQGVHSVMYLSSAGPTIQFFCPDQPPPSCYWNALIPIDDESDDKFIQFVVDEYRKHHA